ncbi:MAG: hypothetical protein H0X13_15580 [Ramlibacter sp.]|nr:hypothetical protein [Ramlibacter sp.]
MTDKPTTSHAVRVEPSGLTLAVIGREHFGNPIPQAWYAAARELLASLPEAPAQQPAPVHPTVDEAAKRDLAAEIMNLPCEDPDYVVIKQAFNRAAEKVHAYAKSLTQQGQAAPKVVEVSLPPGVIWRVSDITDRVNTQLAAHGIKLVIKE